MDGKGWFHNLDQVLLGCLAGGLADGGKLYGGEVSRWDYGTYNQLTIKQPVGDQLPLVARYFNIGPIAMSGSSTTVKQTTRRLGPSMRFVANLADWDQSLNNLTMGESGQILSAHYKDQWDAYYPGHSLPMRFVKIEAKSTLTVNPN